MYTPTTWPKTAETLATYAEFLHKALGTSNSTVKRSLPTLPDLERRQTNSTNDDDPAPDYAFQGVTCADAIDAGNVTTKDVFDFLVTVTRTVSQMCRSMLLRV